MQKIEKKSNIFYIFARAAINFPIFAPELVRQFMTY